MRVRTPDTSFLQHRLAEFATIKPEVSVTGTGTTESEIRNIGDDSGDCDSVTQIGRTPTNIGDCDIARGILAASNAGSILQV